MFRLRTLGGAMLEGPDGPLAGAALQSRRLALLALLAASRPGISRDRVVGMLWPERPEDRARHALSQLVYALRRDLGDVIGGGTSLLTLDRSRLASDVDELELALDRDEWERAIDLYRGPFLDGFYLNDCPDFERWVEDERTRIAQRIERAHERLARRAAEAGDHAGEARWWEKLATLVPLDGRIAQLHVRALMAAGNRTTALQRARLHDARVRAELGCAPDPAIGALIDELSRDSKADARRALQARDIHAMPQAESHDSFTPAPRAEVGSAPVGRARGWRRILVAPSVFAVVTATAFVGMGLTSTAALGARTWAVLADVENATGDPVFERTVPVAIAASLAQSDRVYVVPPTRISTARARMRLLASDSALGTMLARELAQREGVKVVIVPSVERADSAFEIGARLIDAESGGVLAAVTERAASRADVIDALDRLGRRLRREFGEPWLHVASHSTPLPQVTTASLEALQKFAQGSRAFEAYRLQEAEDAWKGAVALDSTFASALAALGGFYYWTNRPALGDTNFARALAHIGPLPARDQLLVRARAESSRGNRDSSVALLRTQLRAHPGDVDVLGMLAYDYVRMKRSTEAADVLSQLAALDSTDHVTWINLATAEKQLQRYPQAIVHYRRAFALMPSIETANGNINHEFGGVFVKMGQLDSAAAVFSKLLAGDALTRARGLRSLAFLSMYRARYVEASASLSEANVLLGDGPAWVSVVRNRLLLATTLSRRGRGREARAQLDTAFVLATRNDVEPTLLLWLGTALARVGDVARAARVLDVVRAREHAGSATDRAAVEGLTGELLVARRRAREAIPHLEAALRADSTALARESLAHALAAAGDLGPAIELYRRIDGTPEFGWEGQERWYLAPYDIGVLEEARSDTVAALAAYGRFLARWRGGDAALPLVTEVRGRVRRLGRDT
ncbi:MAG: tetratricopeptide repeat protein [Gemmatimonadaceae bacterium]|nr:tetratricopeptide repeat protein [Gemmatimonadaceae bacterium]